MNELDSPSKEQPKRRPVKLLVWLGVLFVASFCVIYGIGLLSQASGAQSLDLIRRTLLLSLVLTLLATAGIPLIRWVCSWRHLRWALFVFASLLTLIALAYAEENWRGKLAWQEHRRQWETKGEKFDFTSFVPPPVPEDKNFAYASIFMPALDMRQGPSGVVWKDTNALARLQEINAELTPPRESRAHLALGSLEKGTFADVPACADFYIDNPNYPH